MSNSHSFKYTVLPPKKTIGYIVSTLRYENGLTQTELSNLIGVTPAAISTWENYGTNMENLISTCSALGYCFEVTIQKDE